MDDNISYNYLLFELDNNDINAIPTNALMIIPINNPKKNILFTSLQ